MQRSCGDAIILDVLRHLLTASKEGSYLGNIRERDHVPDRAEICILWLRSFASDGVVVKGHLLHAKLRLAGFDLNAGTLAAAYESLEQFIKLFDGICSCTNVVAVNCKFMPQRFEITFRVL